MHAIGPDARHERGICDPDIGIQPHRLVLIDMRLRVVVGAPHRDGEESRRGRQRIRELRIVRRPAIYIAQRHSGRWWGGRWWRWGATADRFDHHPTDPTVLVPG